MCSTVLFTVSTIVSRNKDLIEKTRLDVINNTPVSIQIPKANTIYVFEVNQKFSSKVPLYSELEVELLDENYNHVYSAYEDLWKERHNNGNGGNSIYADTKVELEIELQHAGLYHIRVQSHNDNKGKVDLTLYSKRGSLYFFAFMIFFGMPFLILFFYLKDEFGIRAILSALKQTKITKTFIIAVIIVIFVFISCVVISYTHHGYPHSGDEIRLPSQFFSTNDVIYLG